MIGILQSLRFVFAVMIFFHHYPVDGVGLFYAGGACGVSFFMILSGFVMSAGYAEKVLEPDFNKKEFILKRLIRLYPLHLLCLLGFLALHITHFSDMHDVIKLLPNVFLLQSWVPIRDIYFSGNAVSWCLADMMFFYAMFPSLAKSLEHKSLKKTCLRFLFPILAVYLSVMVLLPDDYCHRLLYISPIFRLMDFFIGMFVHKLYCTLKSKGLENRITSWSYIRKSLMETLLVLFLALVIIAVPHLAERYIFAALWWLVMPGFILYFAFVNKSGG